jgi:hypothetical protein
MPKHFEDAIHTTLFENCDGGSTIFDVSIFVFDWSSLHSFCS